MKNGIMLLSMAAILVSGCNRAGKEHKNEAGGAPVVLDGGNQVVFNDPKSLHYFETEKVNFSDLKTDLSAPANVTAIVLRSEEGADPIILFENPELAGNYTQLLQHKMNMRQLQEVAIPQRKVELSRVEELKNHGAASGRELLEAQTNLSIERTNLANERAALAEHETKLKAAGFSPEKLKQAQPGTAIVVCDVPENQINQLVPGNSCKLTFTSFPTQQFDGKIDAIADLLDVSTRMVKVRIVLKNSDNQLKSGMFANVDFGIDEGKVVHVSEHSLVTVQGDHYVFVKKGNTFLRRQVTIGHACGDRILILSGLSAGEEIASRGVMQLKGLSFGY